MKGFKRYLGLVITVTLFFSMMVVPISAVTVADADIRLAVKTPQVANSTYNKGLYEPLAGIYFGASYEDDNNIQKEDDSRYEITEINNVYNKKNSAYLMHLNFGDSIETIATALDQADNADVAVVLVWETDTTYADMSAHKTYIQETIEHLRWLDVPVFLSYGARMNNNNIADGPSYVKDYRYVANIARDVASDIALVWTVDDENTVDIDSYYPGDAYVDWIGISSFIEPGDDALASIGDIVYRYGNYKPVMLTEVGTARYNRRTGKAMDEWAIAELGRLHVYAPIMYPQIKGIFVRNSTYTGNTSYLYDMYGSEDVVDAYNDIVKSDVFLSDLTQSGDSRLALIDSRKDPAVNFEGTSAEIYTVIDNQELARLEVRYYLDDRKVEAVEEAPYKHRLQVTGVTDEKHTLTVKVYDGSTQVAERAFTVIGTDDGALIESGEYDVIHFNDIRMHWAEQYIINVSKRGLVVGSNGVFRPDDLISRAEMTSVLTKLGKLPINGTVTFRDVPSGKWYHQYVGNASRYLVGYGNYFYPNQYATREEIITALVKMKGYNVEDLTQKDRDDFVERFWDQYLISQENKDYMILAVKYDILSGYEDGTIRPGNNMKRGEVAKVLYTAFYQ